MSAKSADLVFIPKVESMVVAPNPANGSFSISTGLPDATYTMTDMSGNTVKAAVPLVSGQLISTSNISSGVYIITVTDGVSTETQKVIIE